MSSHGKPWGKRRAFGQHFLKDPRVIRTIVDTFAEGLVERGCRSVLEIGPGKGALTLPLMQTLGPAEKRLPVVISERDRELVASWHEKFPELNVVEGDFLDLPDERWLGQPPLGVISNLPYSAGTAIVVRLAAHPERIPWMVLMFQKEVAERLHAKPSTADWGSLSVWIQNRWEVKRLVTVPPGAFMPPPEVWSEVVTLEPRKEPHVLVPPDREKAWNGLLRACFAHRRKMLRSGLPKNSPQRIALEASGVDGTKRAEALDWDEWRRLFAALPRSGQ